VNLRSILKVIKLNESTISMALGVFVVLAVVVLAFNYFKGQNAGKNQLTPSASTENTSDEYIVQKGDSLWSISMKYYDSGFKWVDIAKANNIKNARAIEVGQKLIIPQPQPNAENAISEAKNEPEIRTQEVTPTPSVGSHGPIIGSTSAENAIVSTNESITGDSYTVVKGDNLWKIAVRAYGDGYRWVEIAKVNNLHNPNLIHPGNVFQLPR
jgi:putative chitinase